MTPISPQVFTWRFQFAGLVGIKIAAVKKTGTDFEQPAQLALAGDLEGALRAGQKGKFRTAPDETAGLFRRVGNGARGFQINAERFFREQIFSGFEHVEINCLVQMVRHGDINDVNFRRGQQFVIIGGEQFHRRHLAKPFALLFHQVANRHQLGLHRIIVRARTSGSARWPLRGPSSRRR